MNIDKYLTNVCKLVAEKGFAKATAELPTWKEALQLPEPEKIDPTVIDALDWIAKTNSRNLYMRSLKSACIKRDIAEKDLPMVASLITTYQRDKAFHEKLKEKMILPIPDEPDPFANSNSEFVGQPGMKIKLDIEDMKVTEFNGYYGLTYIYQFRDVHGHVYVWKTQTKFEHTPSIIAEVKDFTIYNGVKQTVLTHVERNETC